MMKWYSEKTLFSYLETVKVAASKSSKFILPVQRVNRPNLDFRGYSGTIASGNIKVGEEIRTVPSNQKAIFL